MPSLSAGKTSADPLVATSSDDSKTAVDALAGGVRVASGSEPSGFGAKKPQAPTSPTARTVKTRRCHLYAVNMLTLYFRLSEKCLTPCRIIVQRQCHLSLLYTPWRSVRVRVRVFSERVDGGRVQVRGKVRVLRRVVYWESPSYQFHG